MNRNLPRNVTISDPRVEVLSVYDNFSTIKAPYKLIVSAFLRITIATRCEFISLLAAETMIIVITIIDSKTLRVRDDAKYLLKLKPKLFKPLNIKLIYFLITHKVPKRENKRRKAICNSTKVNFTRKKMFIGLLIIIIITIIIYFLIR